MDKLLSQIEAMIFASSQPISYKKISSHLDIAYDEIKAKVAELVNKYEQHDGALELVEINSSVQLVVKSDYADIVDKLYSRDSKRLLTSAELEVLSIIAYKQPVTRREISNIRGINSARVVNSLMDLSLVKISGKRETAGLPVLYSTTDTFLLKFGLKSLKELPKIEEIDANVDFLFEK